MVNEKHRDVVGQQAPQVGAQGVALRSVEARSRLIEEDQLRLGGQGPGHSDQLTLAMGQVGWEGIGLAGLSGYLEGPFDSGVNLRGLLPEVQSIHDDRVPAGGVGGHK